MLVLHSKLLEMLSETCEARSHNIVFFGKIIYLLLFRSFKKNITLTRMHWIKKKVVDILQNLYKWCFFSIQISVAY